MKQLSIALLILSFTSSGFAEVKVGDLAYFTGSQVSKCGTSKMKVQMSSEITEVNSFSVNVLVRVKYDSKPTTSYQNLFQIADFPDGKSLQDYYDLKEYCSHFKTGSLEEVIVPAGKFWTCHLANKIGDASAEVWLGPVALGTVKSRTTRIEFNDPTCVFEETIVLEKFSFAN
ncbi:hypothetical protein D3C87_190520 [compost metagenome]